MAFLDTLKEVAAGFKQAIGTSWWLEINTSKPRCTYYFGPFRTDTEARTAQSGYVEDLKSEGAQEINVTLKRCRNPGIKTICYEDS